MSLDFCKELTREAFISKHDCSEEDLTNEESITSKRDAWSLVNYLTNHDTTEARYAIAEKLRYGRKDVTVNFARRIHKAAGIDEDMRLSVVAFAMQDMWKTETIEDQWKQAKIFDMENHLDGSYERRWIAENKDQWNDGFDGSIGVAIGIDGPMGANEVVYARNARRIRLWLLWNGFEGFITEMNTPYKDYIFNTSSWYDAPLGFDLIKL